MKNLSRLLSVFALLILFANSSFSQANAGPDQNVCSTSTTLFADDPFPEIGVWTGAPSGTSVIENPTLFNTNVTNLEIGENLFTWTIGEDSDYVIITNNTVIANAGPDQTVCEDFATLTAGPIDPVYNATGTWAPVGTIALLTPNTTDSRITTATFLDSGAHLFRWTVSNGFCSAFDAVRVTNNSVTASVSQDQTICEDFTTITAAIPAVGTGTWSVLAGSANIDNITSCITSITNLSSTNILTWTVLNGNCFANDDIIIINNSVTANAGSDQSICENTTILDAGSLPLSKNGYWTTAATAVFSDITSTTSNVTNLLIGSNTLTWTVIYENCTDSDNVEIINNSVTANIETENVTVTTDSYTLSATEPIWGEGYWTVTMGLGYFENYTNYNTTVSSLNYGANSIEWVVTNQNCVDFDEIIITRESPFSAGIDQEICTNSTIMAADDPFPQVGVWTVVSGNANIENTTQYNTNVTGLHVGVTVLEWAVGGEADWVVITNNSFTVGAGVDQLVCVDEASLSAVEIIEGVGNWTIISGAGVITNPTLATTIISTLGTNQNIIRWSVMKNGCSASDDVVITNRATHATTIDKHYCWDNTNTTLEGSQPDTNEGEFGYWSDSRNGQYVYVNSTYNTTVSGLLNGTNVFTWTVQNEECSSSSNSVVTYVDMDISAGEDADICIDTYELSATDPELYSGTGSWMVIGGVGTFEDDTYFGTIVTDLSSGINNFRWTVTVDGCTKFDQVTINMKAPYSDAGSDQTVCESSATLNAVALLPGETGYWDQTAGSGTVIITDPTNHTTTVSNLSSGINSFQWTVTNGICTAPDQVVIFYNKVTANAGGDIEVCESSITLNAFSPNSEVIGSWSGSGILTFDNVTAFNSTVYNLQPGINTITWTVSSNGCSDVDYLNIFNNQVTAHAGPDQTICEDFTNLAPNELLEGETGYWGAVGGSGIIIENTASSTYSVIDLGNMNIFIWTVSNGTCQANDQVMIVSNIVTASTGGDFAICSAETFLTGVIPDGGNGIWTPLASGSSAIIVEPTNATSEVSNLNAGINTFRWTVTVGDCSDNSDLVVNNNLYPAVAAIAGVDEICQDNVYLMGNIPIEGTTGIWTIISGGADFVNNTVANTQVINLARGPNQLVWTITKDGCTNSDTITVTNNAVIAFANEDAYTCDGTFNLQAGFEPTEPGISGQWSLVAGTPEIQFDDINSESAIVSNLGSGNSIFRWTIVDSESGCSDYEDVAITDDRFEISAGQDFSVCTSEAQLNAETHPNTSGYWTGFGTATMVTPTLNSTMVTGLTPYSQNVFTWTVTRDVSGCMASDQVTVTNNEVIANAGDDITITTDSYTQTATLANEETGTWSLISGSANIISQTDPNTELEELNYGENTFSWFVEANGCNGEDFVTITRTVDVLGEIITDSDSCQLSAELPDGAIGEWTIMYGSADIDNPSDPNTWVRNLGVGETVFRWTVTFPGRGLVIWNEVTVHRAVGVEKLETITKVFPNPSEGLFTIKSLAGFNEILITDVSGKIVFHQELNAIYTNAQIDLTQFSSGVYYVKIKNENIVTLKKLILR